VKPAKFETSAGALAAFLASRPASVMLCDLYTFAPIGSINGGAPLLYTTADVDIVVPYAAGTPLVTTGPPLAAAPLAAGPTRYSSSGVYFDQLQNKAYGHWKAGLDVDTWQVICTPSPQATIGGQPFLAALRARALDGAVAAVDRAFIDNRDGVGYAPALSPLGVVNVFTGRVAEIDLGRSNAVISINSHLDLLSQNMPRNLYQSGCRWTLFGAGCNLDASSFAIAGSVASDPAAGSNQLSIWLVSYPGGSGSFTLGHIVMTGGANAGFSRSIRSWIKGGVGASPGTLALMAPFPFRVATSDTFIIYPGCDKQLSTCNAFGNAPNFGGMPFIPAPEMSA